MDFSGKIKRKREELRLSQEFMAVQLNITQASYSRMESGYTKPSAARLLQLSEIFKCSVLEFFEKPEEKAKQQIVKVGQLHFPRY